MASTTTTAPTRVWLQPLPSLADADLVRRARGGDDGAFEEIVRRYRAPLIRYSARHVGRDHAEDVTQHALARAAMHLRDDPRPIHLRAWLYRVAHNAAINMRQRKDWAHEQLSPDIDGVPQPPELAAQRGEVRQVVSDLDRLPDRQRTALLLSVFEGLSYDEIAARLDTSPNSVRALLSRARVHLRRAAAAIAPLPLLQSLVRKASGLASTAGGQGTLASGGGAIQANLAVVAAMTVAAAGVATAERAISRDRAAVPEPAALVDQGAAPLETALPLDPALLLPGVLDRAPSKSHERRPAPARPEPAAAQEPAEVPPVAPPEPATEAPRAKPAPPVDEAPPADDTSTGGPTRPGETNKGDEPPPDGGTVGEQPTGDGYTESPPDPYTPSPTATGTIVREP